MTTELKWMPLDIGWYHSHTMFLRTDHHGAYMLLICQYWQVGHLPDDDRMLARITRQSLRQWRKMRPTIAQLFECGWVHPYLDGLRAKAEAGYARRLAYIKANDARRPPPAEWAVIRNRIFERDNYTCTYCGTRGGELQCDHVIPIARDGTNDDGNLTTACKPCNLSKHSRMPEEWLSSRTH